MQPTHPIESEIFMTEPSTFTCPTCGAPLDIEIEDLDEPVLHCQYCNATIDNPKYQPPQPVTSPPPSPPDRAKPRTYHRPSRSSSCAEPAGKFILLLAMLVFGGGTLLALALASRAKGPILPAIFPLQIRGRGAQMLHAVSGAPQLIAETYNVNKGSYAISRLDMASHEARWSALSQKDYLYLDALLTGDTNVYLVVKNRLIALQISDGRQAWEASLPGELPGGCKNCVSLQQGQLIVVTNDSSLGAYDALTGHQTWEKRFDNTGNTLYPLGDAVGLSYSMDGVAVLGIFDVSSGNERLHIAPTCQPAGGMQDEMEVYSQILADAASPSAKAYFFFGFFNACVQRWDLSSGKMDWEYLDEDQDLGSPDSSPVLAANDRLFFSLGDQLVSLDISSGAIMQTLDETQDYGLVPLLVEGQRLIVRAKRSRGSDSYELWGYDLNSGKNLWKHPILQGTPLDPPLLGSVLIDSDEPGWTYLQAPDGLWLITFRAQPNQVDLARVDLDTGEWTEQKSLPLGLATNTDSYQGPARIASRDNLAWFTLEEDIYAIDPAGGAYAYRWP
jgi:outer membrane protein assembly factor BamB